jgi:hypothetical protein
MMKINMKNQQTNNPEHSQATFRSLILSKRSNRQLRATALVLVVVLLALLAILGTSFVLTTRVEQIAAKNQLANGQINQSTDAIIEVIKSTLAEDLWGSILPTELSKSDTDLTAMKGQRLLCLPFDANGDTTGTLPIFVKNEPWDAPTGYTVYPGGGTPAQKQVQQAIFTYHDATGWHNPPATIDVDGDPWLADSALALTSQITNIFNYYWPTSAPQTTSWNVNSVPAADRATVTADADGDGGAINDSIWLVQNGFFPVVDANGFARVTAASPALGLATDLPIKSSDPNLAYRMAVRIVDTCGMVNVNTAWQWPSNLPAAANSQEQLNQYSGNMLPGMNLYGCTGSAIAGSSGVYTYNNSLGYTGTSLPGKAQVPTIQDLVYFQNYYVSRIENPNWTQLNNLSTEILNSTKELANFSPLDLSDELELRYKWNSTENGVNINSGVSTVLKNAFDLTTNPDVRSRLTAYSFSRNIRRMIQDIAPTGVATDSKLDAFGPIGVALSCSGIQDGFYPRKIDFVQGLYQWLLYIKNNRVTTGIVDFNENYRRAFALGLFEILKQGTADIDLAVAEQDDVHRSFIVAQYIANLIDAVDDDSVPTILLPADFANILPTWNTIQAYVAGLEKTPIITELFVYRIREATLPDYNNADLFRFEIYNPWTATHGGQKDFNLAATPFFYQIKDGSGTILKTYTSIGTGTLTGGSFLPPIDISSDFHSTPMPTSGEIILYQRLISGQYVMVDSFAFNIGSAANYVDDTTSTDADKIGVTWNWIQRDTNGWLMFSDRHLSIPAADQIAGTGSDHETGNDYEKVWILKSLGSIPGPTKSYSNLGTVADGQMEFANPAPKSYGLWFNDTLANSAITLDNLRTIVGNPEVASLVLYSGNVENIGTVADRINQPLSYRLDELNDPARKDEKGIRISFLNTDNLGRYFMEYFTLLERASDSKDQLNRDGDNDDTTQPDNLDEQRLPGLINVNTANVNSTSWAVLQSLHPYITAVNAPTMAYNGVNRRLVKSASELISLLLSPGGDLGVQGVTGDLEEQQLVWSRISNLITTRSDTFVAYILVELLDAEGKTVNQRREIVLFDRSLCNQPPLQWNTTTNVWEPNPAYRPVKVVARQAVN